MHKVLEFAVRQPLIIRVDGAEYTVEFTVPAVVLAEEKLGHSLKTLRDWLYAPAKDVPVLLEAGLMCRHPEDAAEIAALIVGILSPETLTELTDTFAGMAFPRELARWKARMETLQAELARGKPLPKAQSADAS